MNLRCEQCGAECDAASRQCQACGAGLVVVCPICRFENRTGDRFCGGCGVELARASAAEELALESAKRDELRTVTVLMADLDGFEAVTTLLGPEHAAEVMREVHARLAQQHIVAAFDGYIDKFLDGDIMALFGAPIAHEDSPERAVRAAVRMHTELAAMHEHGLLPPRTPLRLRIGLNTGMVRVGGVGAGGRIEYTAMGDTVNLAARLMTTAEWGATLISEATCRRVAPSFELEELEAVRVKGKAEPQRIWAVRAEGRRAARIEIASSEGMARLVGRDELMAELREARGAAAGGQGRIVGICGEAGIGKSRLVYELHQELGDEVTFLEGRCLSYGEQLSYTPVRDVLAVICDLRDADSAAERQAKVEAAIAAHGLGPADGPPVGYLLGLDFDDDAFARLDPRELRDLLRQAFGRLFAAVCERRPVILFVDDLQWCDVDSLELFDHLATGCASQRLLMIAAYRRDFAHDWDRLPWFRRLQPRRLTADETRAMVGSLLQRRGVLGDEHRIDDSLATACYQKSQGNPFFVDQTVTALLQRAEQTGKPTIDPRRGRLLIAYGELDHLVPDSVEEILLSRIDQLPAGPRSVLQAASVAMIGRWFRASALRAVLDHPDLDAALELLEHRDLIRADSDDDGDRLYVFEHALARDVAYHALLRAERRRLHGRVGDYIERHYASSLEAYVDDLAHHFYHSEATAKAAAYLPQSADRAARRYSNEQAKLQYRRAVEVLEQLADESSARSLLEVLRGLITVQSLTGDPAVAEAGAARLELARRLGEQQAAIDASFTLARYYTEIGRFEDARTAWEQVLEGYQSTGQWDGARDAEAGIGQLCQLQGRAREALDHFQAATRIQVERLEFDPFGTWMQYNNLAAASYELGRIRQSLAACDQADAALSGLEPDDPLRMRLQSYSAGNRGNALAAQGHLRRALDEYATTLADAAATGERIVETEVRCRIGAVQLITGDLIEAREQFDEALALAGETGLTRWAVAARAGLAELARLMGYRDAADGHLGPARELIAQAGELAGAEEVALVAARLAGDAGDWERAAGLLRAASQTAAGYERGLTELMLRPELALAEARRGHRGEANALAAKALEGALSEGLILTACAARSALAETADSAAAALAHLAAGLEAAAEAGAAEVQLALLAHRLRRLAEGADREAAEALLESLRQRAGEAYLAAARARHGLGEVQR